MDALRRSARIERAINSVGTLRAQNQATLVVPHTEPNAEPPSRALFNALTNIENSINALFVRLDELEQRIAPISTPGQDDNTDFSKCDRCEIKTRRKGLSCLQY